MRRVPLALTALVLLCSSLFASIYIDRVPLVGESSIQTSFPANSWMKVRLQFEATRDHDNVDVIISKNSYIRLGQGIIRYSEIDFELGDMRDGQKEYYEFLVLGNGDDNAGRTGRIYVDVKSGTYDNDKTFEVDITDPIDNPPPVGVSAPTLEPIDDTHQDTDIQLFFSLTGRYPDAQYVAVYQSGSSWIELARGNDSPLNVDLPSTGSYILAVRLEQDGSSLLSNTQTYTAERGDGTYLYPKIDSFSADKTCIKETSDVTFSWGTTNATSVTLNASSVSIDGSETRTVSSTTTFILQACNAQGDCVENSFPVVLESDPLPTPDPIPDDPTPDPDPDPEIEVIYGTTPSDFNAQMRSDDLLMYVEDENGKQSVGLFRKVEEAVPDFWYGFISGKGDSWAAIAGDIIPGSAEIWMPILGAGVGCLITIEIGCAPGAVAGAKIGFIVGEAISATQAIIQLSYNGVDLSYQLQGIYDMDSDVTGGQIGETVFVGSVAFISILPYTDGVKAAKPVILKGGALDLGRIISNGDFSWITKVKQFLARIRPKGVELMHPDFYKVITKQGDDVVELTPHLQKLESSIDGIKKSGNLADALKNTPDGGAARGAYGELVPEYTFLSRGQGLWKEYVPKGCTSNNGIQVYAKKINGKAVDVKFSNSKVAPSGYTAITDIDFAVVHTDGTKVANFAKYDAVARSDPKSNYNQAKRFMEALRDVGMDGEWKTAGWEHTNKAIASATGLSKQMVDSDTTETVLEAFEFFNLPTRSDLGFRMTQPKPVMYTVYDLRGRMVYQGALKPDMIRALSGIHVIREDMKDVRTKAFMR